MRVVAIVMGVLLWTSSAHAATGVVMDMPRGGRWRLVYRPPPMARGTIVMGSGDVGWVGLAVSRARELSTDGYVVVGDEYAVRFPAFTVGTSSLGWGA